MKRKREEFCIMPECPENSDYRYAIHRFYGAHRHEVFFGKPYRQKSIDRGLVVFLMPQDHDMGKYGVHFNRKFDLWLKRIGQRTAMQVYGWTIDDFRAVFGKNYLEDEERNE